MRIRGKPDGRTEITSNDVKVPRNLEHSFLYIYRAILDEINGKETNLCKGSDILKPHIINQYGISDEWQQACKDKTLAESGMS